MIPNEQDDKLLRSLKSGLVCKSSNKTNAVSKNTIQNIIQSSGGALVGIPPLSVIKQAPNPTSIMNLVLTSPTPAGLDAHCQQ